VYQGLHDGEHWPPGTQYEVEAVTPEEAQALAEEMFDGDGKRERGDNHEIEEVCDPRLVE
jgi:hypothetical protein